MEKSNISSEVSKHMSAITASLALFLEQILPTLSDDWWEKTVVTYLSFQQRKKAEQSGTTSLQQLDLAALLRVLDQNWYQVSNSLNLTSESRHFVKEMQTIRNRWAHMQAEGLSYDDMYRDVDTLQRFAGVINANEAIIQKIQKTKENILHAKLPTQNIKKTTQNNEFEVGQIVSLKSNAQSKGAIIGIIPGNPEMRYSVFIDGAVQTFYASQLQLDIGQKEQENIVTCEEFHAHLTALQLKYPGLSTLYSLNAARIDFIPYQFRPVLRFIRSDRPRLLIADGVGVGKTIEAGLILRELQARREIRSVLIICPRPLVTEKKWQNEMKRFEERFTHLDSATLNYCINEMDLEGTWPEQHSKTIIPYSLFDESLLFGTPSKSKGKRKLGLLNLDPPPRFDLVIVDEAHHVRNSNTFSHKAVRFFCDNAEAAIFLTATPIQLGSADLFVLLNILRPDLVIDWESFQHMSEPNPFINEAITHMRTQGYGWTDLAKKSLDSAANTAWGKSILKYNPIFTQINEDLARKNISQEERIKMISDTEELHTLASLINRTRRRDIGNFTIRRSETVLVPFTDEQQLIHDEILHIQAKILSALRSDVNVGFMLSTIRRQVASCLFGLIPFLSDILNRHLDELALEDTDINLDTLETFNVDLLRTQIEQLIEIARDLPQEDPKFDALQGIILEKQTTSKNKVMVFSSFRHTLNYLFNRLQQTGFRVGLIHGNVPDEERIHLRTRFEHSKEHPDCLDILLFSEIGCEGLDYQFCDCMVNYDLPWNPMRIEQRIGRIDRNGQESEYVSIINMITPGTVDADIYERCLMRIGIFEHALGAGEEILGEISQQIKSIAENQMLNDTERIEKFQQLADNKIRTIQEQERLEQKQVEFFSIRLPQDQMKKDIANAESYWLSASSLYRIVNLYLKHLSGKELENILGEKDLKTLRLAHDVRNSLLKDFRKLPRQSTSSYRQWELWLKGDNQHLSITFEPSCAIQNPQAAFIMPLHPLVKQAANFFENSKRIISYLKVKTNSAPAGEYPFAIYQWRIYGVNEDLIIKPVVADLMVAEHINILLEKAENDTKDLSPQMGMHVWDSLDEQHYALWISAKKMHEKKTQDMTAYKSESLTTSHKARITLLKEQLDSAKDEKIKRMRTSQIEAADADYARHIQELDMAMEKLDIIANPVAYGVLRVVSEV